MEATAAQVEFLSRADHKEESKGKFEFLLTLLLEEKKRNEGEIVLKALEQSFPMIWEIIP